MLAENKAREILRQTEGELRSLMTEAAQLGRYAAVARLAAWAQKIAEIETATPASSADRGAVTNNVSLDDMATVREQPDASLQIDAATGRARRTTKKRRRSRKKNKSKATSTVPGDFPQFFRQRNDLVKVGWSKKTRKKYQHKASWSATRLVVKAIASAARNGDLLRTEDFMPVADTAGGMEVPGYQAYLCLAWLKKEALAVPQGRQGYVVRNPGSLAEEAERRWRDLPSKNQV